MSQIFRVGVLVIISLSNLLAQDVATGSKSIILFVCEHGAARSAIASAYFNKLAQEKGLNYSAIFRGTNADSVLTPGTVKGLSRDGFDIKEWKPIQVTQADLNTASQTIMFDCALPPEIKYDKPIQKWDGVPPISIDYGIARDQIKKNVEKLIQELGKEKK